MRVGNDDPRELTRMLQGSKKYTCPFCGSGDGERGTPAFTVYDDHYYCYSCHKRGDIYDLIAKVENIPPNTRRVFKRAEELFKDGNDDGLAALQEWRERQAGASKRKNGTDVDKAQKADYGAYIRECHAAVNQTDYWAKRGIGARSIKHFRLGYDPKFNSVVIPYSTDNSYYMHRSVEGKRIYKRPTEEAGPEPIFNCRELFKYQLGANPKPIFVCEGQIDAISFYEVSHDAVAIGGTCNIGKLLAHLAKYAVNRPLILALDNDDRGREATQKLTMALEKDFYFHYIANVYGDNKDANEAWLKNPTQFEAEVSCVVERVRERDNYLRSLMQPFKYPVITVGSKSYHCLDIDYPYEIGMVSEKPKRDWRSNSQ